MSRIAPDTDLDEALRLLARENAPQILLVTSAAESLDGIVTKTDILRSLGNGAEQAAPGRGYARLSEAASGAAAHSIAV